jgi:hypothetical protein
MFKDNTMTFSKAPSKIELNKMFDYKDGQLYWKKGSRNGIKPGTKAGVYHSSGYLVIRIFGKRYRTHRLIFMMHHGQYPVCVDHIDGNKLNNHIENLRGCDHNQNMHNRKISSNNKSGIKGIIWHKSAKKWWPQLMINSKRLNLGMYDDLELAELVIKEARNLYHGDFARHN